MVPHRRLPISARHAFALAFDLAVRRDPVQSLLVPWLFVTELLRNIVMFGAGLFLVLPGVWVGFRLSLATEAAVLRDTSALGAFQRSFHLTAARLERWLEMIAISVVAVLAILFACVIGFFTFAKSPWSTWSTWATVALLALPLV